MISPFVHVRRLSYSAWAFRLFVLVEGFTSTSVWRISKERHHAFLFLFTELLGADNSQKDKLL